MSEGYRFSGGTSFMSNGYVIWTNGLAGEEPNWFGVKQGSTYVDRMFYTRSLDQRSSFYEFVQFLNQIVEKEATKERTYINLKLEKMRSNIIEKERVPAIQRAVDDNNFGVAYKLLLDLDRSIEKLKEELGSKRNKNFSHMNQLWETQFSYFLQKTLERNTEIQEHRLVAKLDAKDLTIDSLVDEWIKESLYGSDGVVVESLDHIKDQMKKEFLGYLKNAGIQGVNSYADNIFGTGNNFTSLSGFKTTWSSKTKGDKQLSHIVKLIADGIGNTVGRGLSQEVATAAEQGRRGAVVINTGSILKEIPDELRKEGFRQVYQKVDVSSFEIFNGSFSIEDIAKKIFSKYGYNQQSYKMFLDALEEAAKEDTGQLFQIDSNIKGYRSLRDLQIEGAGSFKQRTRNLIKMAEEAEGIPAFSMEKLIFMLNNTVEGCIADNNIESLTTYIAAVCTAWMWDDYTELFSLSENGSNIQKIRMFNSGGFYYSASQIIRKTVDELLDNYKGSSFVVVDIRPPSFDADAMYLSLKDRYPIPQTDNKQEWQSALAPRWNEIRDYVSAHGTISIKMQQAGLEKLISNLTQYL